MLLAFLALNVWVAIDHLRIEVRANEEANSSLDGTRSIAEQRAALLAARPDNGPIDLEMMRNTRVQVPDAFIREGHFASPWGPSVIMKAGDLLVWDFYEITTTGCTQLLEGPIPGVIRAASSGGAADERPAPLAPELAAEECRRTPLITRLILK